MSLCGASRSSRAVDSALARAGSFQPVHGDLWALSSKWSKSLRTNLALNVVLPSVFRPSENDLIDVKTAKGEERSIKQGSADSTTSETPPFFEIGSLCSCGFLELWLFCTELSDADGEDKVSTLHDPRMALHSVGLRLAGPYNLLKDNFPANINDTSLLNRFFYDIPECQCVLVKCSPISSSSDSLPRKSTSVPECTVAHSSSHVGCSLLDTLFPPDYHLCLFRDRAEEVPHAVVSNSPSQGSGFTLVCAAPKEVCTKISAIDSARTSTINVSQAPLSSSDLDASVDIPAQTKRSMKKKDMLQSLEHATQHAGDYSHVSEPDVQAFKAEAAKSTTLQAAQPPPAIPLLLAAVFLHCESILRAYENDSLENRERVHNRKRAAKDLKKAFKRKRATDTVERIDNFSAFFDGKADDHKLAKQARMLKERLRTWIQKCLQIELDVSKSIIESTTKWKKWRTKAIVCQDFSGLGVVVPYNKKTQVGYRNLGYTDAQLKRLLTKMKGADKTDPKSEQPLQELLTLAGIAMDEGDVGTALQLGRNLLLADTIEEKTFRLIRPAKMLLKSAYTLLDQQYFCKVVEALSRTRV